MTKGTITITFKPELSKEDARAVLMMMMIAFNGNPLIQSANLDNIEDVSPRYKCDKCGHKWKGNDTGQCPKCKVGIDVGNLVV